MAEVTGVHWKSGVEKEKEERERGKGERGLGKGEGRVEWGKGDGLEGGRGKDEGLHTLRPPAASFGHYTCLAEILVSVGEGLSSG